MINPWLATRNRTGQEYDAPYAARAAAGMDVHGEANLVEHLLQSPFNQSQSHQPYRVLDAGCGTGRTAIQLARRWSTWEQAPWQPGDRYAVSVHRK